VPPTKLAPEPTDSLSPGLAKERHTTEEVGLKEPATKLEQDESRPIEERRRQEEVRAVVEAKASKTQTPATKTEPGMVAVQPDTTTPKTGETPAIQTDARAVTAQRLFSAVLKETAPLLAQNKFADAIALLEHKAKDPALADAAELLKQEQADIETAGDLRRQALEALRKQVGQQLTLRKGGVAFKGKVVSEPKPDVVTLDMGGAQMTFSALQLSPDDVEQYAPRTGNVGADLRQRGIMYLAAGNVAKAKEYFGKPQTLNPEPYLDRITAVELGEVEAAALKSWEQAERRFAAKDMKGANAAYEAFERDYGKTQTAVKQTAALTERYDALEKVLGPAPMLTLDLGGGVKMELVLVKAGEFIMGAADNEGLNEEKPAHKVKISKPYYMGQYEVTVAQFRAFADATKNVTEAEKAGEALTWKDGKCQSVKGTNWRTPGFPQEDNYPACAITWSDAREFCKWAAKQTGRKVSLPTEAQWEYACRAGTTTRYNSGDLDQAAWSNKNSGMHTNAVGQKKPNAWGLYDMHGNVWEWLQDWMNDKYYGESPPVDPKGPVSGVARVVRGGGWDDSADGCRSAHREGRLPGNRYTPLGFRVVVDF
jgi:formylglycine-generating enzyme required for sulfatase activity